jgi:hypothetical protein
MSSLGSSLLIFVLAATCASAQQRSASSEHVAAVLDCALNRGDSWIEGDLIVDGQLMFNTLAEPSQDSPGQTDVYLAVWKSPNRDGGRLLLSSIRTEGTRTVFIVNDGLIRLTDIGLDLEDAWGGVYTHRELRRRLLQLSSQPIERMKRTAIQHTDTACRSILDAFGRSPRE